jgi:DNA-binding response OmpR family regulator
MDLDVVRLPRSMRTEATGSAAKSRHRDLPSRLTSSCMSLRVLIADDNRDAAESLGVLLNMGGDEVLVVEDGSAAVEAAREWRPDLAVLDLDMPVMNGFAGALALRAEAPDLLLVALSGYLDEENRGRAVAIGFDLCVTKGGEFADLRRQLDALIQRRAEQRAAAVMPAPGGADAALPIST